MLAFALLLCVLALTNAQKVNVTHQEIVHRAAVWVDRKIPFCQCNSQCCGRCPYCPDYRCDDDGYLSWSWKLPGALPEPDILDISRRITESELLPGDILLTQGHYIIFDTWVNTTHYHGYEMLGCNAATPGAVHRVIPYPYFHDGKNYEPYRYKFVSP